MNLKNLQNGLVLKYIKTHINKEEKKKTQYTALQKLPQDRPIVIVDIQIA